MVDILGDCSGFSSGVQSQPMRQSVTTLPDSELVSNVEQGDKLAEGALYEKYSSRVYFLALGELHSREDAEDVRAETFLRVLQALRQGQLRKPDSLPSYIVGIALNVIREFTRKKSATEPLDGRDLEAAGERSAESVFLDQETRLAVADVAKRLKPRDREFLRMFYYEELPREEIARVLGVSEERVRLIKSRALKRFREVYEKLKIK
jgi:RNA polymerase sigma factor (sigma-70 family)